jgi:hypothetical protein
MGREWMTGNPQAIGWWIVSDIEGHEAFVSELKESAKEKNESNRPAAHKSSNRM